MSTLQTPVAPVEELVLRTGDRTTHAYRAGAGHSDPVLLLHGGGPGAQAWSNWRPTLEAMGARFDVVAPDLLGFGTSEHPDPPLYGPRAWLDARCDQLVGLLDTLGLERADLVGNSLGGALALTMAVRFPARVRRLVLMGSGGAPFTPGPELLRMLGFYGDPTAENLRAILQAFVHDLDGFGDVRALVDARLEVAVRPDAQRSFEAMFRTEDGKPIGEIALPEATIREIPHPTLVVHGRDDRIVPVANSHWLFDRLPGAELHLLPRCGHWAMLEHPATFARIVTEFLSRPTEVVA